MQYLRPYTYFLGKPGGTNNLLYGSLALLSGLVVPIVGQVVVLGYASEVAEDLEHDPDLADHRDFTFNKFSDYLSRGVWPMLTQLVVVAAFLFLLLVVAAIGLGAYFATEDPTIAAIVFGVCLVPLMTFTSMVVWPMTLHAQLSRSFRLGEAVRFTASFLRAVGLQLVLALMVHSIISFPLSLFGMMLCFVGVYPAMMVQVMAHEHFMLQLYRLYLDEGGARIEVRGESRERDGDDE